MAIAELALWVVGSSIIRFSGFFQVPLLIVFGIWRSRGHGIVVSIPYKSIAVWTLFFSLLHAFVATNEIGGLTDKYAPLVSSGFVVPLSEEIVYRLAVYIVISERFEKVLPTRENFALIYVIASTLLFLFAHRNNTYSMGDWAVCGISSIAFSIRFFVSKNFMEIFLMHAFHNLHAILESPGNHEKGAYWIPCVFYATIAIVSVVGNRYPH